MSIPISFQLGEFDSGMCFIEGIISGEAIKFRVDTGANISFVGDHKKTAHLEKLGEATKGGASGNIIFGDKIQVPQLQIDSKEFMNIIIQRFHSSPLNYLGMDILGKYPVSLNFREKIFSWEFTGITQKEKYQSSGKGHPILPCLLDDKKLQVLFDTGAEITCVDSAFATENKNAFSFIQSVQGGTDVNGLPVSMDLCRMKALKVGDTTFEDSAVLAIDFSPFREKIETNAPIILGFNHMAHHSWSFAPDTMSWSVG